MERAATRRDVFAPHVDDPRRLGRCPVCQWALGRDHAEALALNVTRGRSAPMPSPPAEESRQAEETYAFALVG